ncbi:sulfurtransferase TusA family protein [Sporosarcina sp. FA9]|uniref:sulfurtransferase TusA family protein n=1 Tax=Sporosarcina sp. FA9 TaxID=3413030 RepID=UPI003F6578AF
MAIKADVKLDAKGLACPMPIIKTKKVMSTLMDGQVLEVTATDKGSKADLAAWSESVGHQYIGTIEQDDVLTHYIRKCSDDDFAEKIFEQTISNEEIIERASNGGLILDVREEAEFAFGHIAGAKSIPMGDLDARLNELDKDQEVYIVCRTGKRSDLAAKKLDNNGFTNVFNVLPGMTSWSGELVKKV